MCRQQNVVMCPARTRTEELLQRQLRKTKGNKRSVSDSAVVLVPPGGSRPAAVPAAVLAAHALPVALGAGGNLSGTMGVHLAARGHVPSAGSVTAQVVPDSENCLEV